MADAQELAPGLTIFRRTDVKHDGWHVRTRLAGSDRYRTSSLRTADLNLAKARALVHLTDAAPPPEIQPERWPRSAPKPRPFLLEVQELKPGLVIFRRGDGQHRRWYCRPKLPKADRYKTVSLRTTDFETAKDRAFDEDAELRFKLKHEMPVFNRPFSQVAQAYADLQKQRAEAGQISHARWKTLDSLIRSALNPYIGTTPISTIGPDRWLEYPLWRKRHGKGMDGAVSDATIKYEMTLFRSIMLYAQSKKYVPESVQFKGKVQLAKIRREEFTSEEYRKLHNFARGWVKRARSEHDKWYRTIAYNFVLIMCNTGMRPTEAWNLRWREVAVRTDHQGRSFVVLSVRGKGKSRSFVAASKVTEYLERVRAIAKVTGEDDPVFTSIAGVTPVKLYAKPMDSLLKESGLLRGASGKRRSNYCFRHTYATFRLMEGVDIYFLAKQMGTSVQMIEDYYGYINPVKSAERILQGMPGWEPIADLKTEVVEKVA